MRSRGCATGPSTPPAAGGAAPGGGGGAGGGAGAGRAAAAAGGEPGRGGAVRGGDDGAGDPGVRSVGGAVGAVPLRAARGRRVAAGSVSSRGSRVGRPRTGWRHFEHHRSRFAPVFVANLDRYRVAPVG